MPDNEIDALNREVVRLYQQGRYEQALAPATRARDLARQHLGEDHPDFAGSLSNLASLYQSMGNYAAAEPLYRQTIEIFRTALGEGDPDFANCLNNLAMLYQSMGNFAAAEPLHRQVLEILRKALGEDHPAFASSLNNLAGLYHAMGNYAAAEPPCRQALEIRRKALGEDHPDFATSLNILAEFYRATGNYVAAEPLFHQALDIWRTALCEGHPDFAQSLNNLAVLYAGRTQPTDAFPLMRQAAAIDDHTIGQVFSIGSEAQRAAFLQKVQANFEAFLSLVFHYLRTSPEATREALDLVLRRKAVGAEALAAQRDAVLAGNYPHLQESLRELTALRMQIAQKTLADPGPEGREVHERLLADWTARKERLEGDLARQIPEMNLERQLRETDRRVVASLMPQGTALVEFVKFDVFDFTAVAERVSESQWQPPRRWQSPRYLAFVLQAGEPDNVRMIDLGEAQHIDALIAEFRGGVTGEGRGLGAPAPLTADEATDRIGAELRARVFDPLREALGDLRRIFLSPDGDLTRLPFEVLPLERDRRLIDDYELRYLAVGRDIVRFGKQATRPPSAPLVAADPDFDLRAGDGGRSTPGSVRHAASAGRQSRDVDRGLRFGRLDGTRREGEAIGRMLGVEPWLDARALEGQLKAVRSPRILHLATHGFFLQDQQRDDDPARRDPGFSLGVERFAASRMENPLLRSGVALAGANTWLAGGQPPEEAEDGILTAEDVTGLDLLDTDLVVLSACETGLGEVRTGEGVFGLRRAFVLAGARTLVMSLWKVPDQQTQELMEDFYRRILTGEARADALRHAQLAIRERFPNPFYWGAFICQGEPGPLVTTA